MIPEAGARRAISMAGHGANVSQIARQPGRDRKTIRLCLPVTFVYAGIGLDRGALLTGPRGDHVAGRFTLIRPARSAPARNGLPSSPPWKAPCGSAGPKTALSSRSRTTCTGAPAA